MSTEQTTTDKYYEARAKRKTSVARARITPASKNSFEVNGMVADEYFKTDELRLEARAALLVAAPEQKLKITIVVNGGGQSSQAGAVKSAVAKAILLIDKDSRKSLKLAGLLSIDSRIKERRKFGLKTARKAPQWSKR